MAEHIQDEAALTAAIERASIARQKANVTEPRATSAHYDVDAGLVVVYLRSGATFSFPFAIAQGLTDASADELAQVELTPSGDALHWECLDADLHLPSLLAGIFGSKKWMAQSQLQWQQVS